MGDGELWDIITAKRERFFFSVSDILNDSNKVNRN